MSGFVFLLGFAVIALCMSAVSIGLYRLGLALNNWRKGNGMSWL